MDLSSLGATSYGVWTRGQALALTTRAMIRSHVRMGYWQEPYPGVYADGGSVLSNQQRAVAALLAAGGLGQDAAAPRVVAAGRTAARLWGLPLIDDDDPATGAAEWAYDDVLTASSRTTSHNGLTLLRRQGHLASEEIGHRADGLVLTTVLRTLFDCAQLLSFEAAVCAADAALHKELISDSELRQEAVRRRWLPGAPAFRRVAAAADGRAESPAETLTRLLLLPHLPGLVPQVQLRDARRRIVARFDLADEEARFAVEADGKRGHAGEEMVAKDRKRDGSTRGYGWLTERVTWYELRRQQDSLSRRVVAAHDDHVRGRAAS